MNRELRISLNENDFRILIEGKILEKNVITDGTIPQSDIKQVKICLQDIGYHKMIELISDSAQNL